MKDCAYFISDAHLGIHRAGCEQRQIHLFTFLEQIRDHASHLIIVGDLFDFWIEYKHAIRPVYFPVLHEIRKLVENGTKIMYLAGNHDFALGPFLSAVIGIETFPGHLDLQLQGKHIHLFHGDGLLKSDFVYRLWSKALRNPINQRLFKCIHPDIGIAFATLCSGTSRALNSKRWSDRKLHELRLHAERFLASSSDIVVFGHSHVPEIHESGGKVYCNTGEWMLRYTYAKLQNGSMGLWDFLPGTQPRQIMPSK